MAAVSQVIHENGGPWLGGGGWVGAHLSVCEDRLGPVEQQQPHVAVAQAEVALQDLQHVDPRPHGQRRVAAEGVQPRQEVVRGHGGVAAGGGRDGRHSEEEEVAVQLIPDI